VRGDCPLGEIPNAGAEVVVFFFQIHSAFFNSPGAGAPGYPRQRTKLVAHQSLLVGKTKHGFEYFHFLYDFFKMEREMTIFWASEVPS
jgi:hypothetical protein